MCKPLITWLRPWNFFAMYDCRAYHCKCMLNEKKYTNRCSFIFHCHWTAINIQRWSRYKDSEEKLARILTQCSVRKSTSCKRYHSLFTPDFPLGRAAIWGCFEKLRGFPQSVIAVQTPYQDGIKPGQRCNLGHPLGRFSMVVVNRTFLTNPS